MADLACSTPVVLVVTMLGIFLVKKLLQMLTGPKLPPGPMPLPLIGNLHQLPSVPDYHLIYHQLANRYGDMMTVTAFNTKFVILNSYEAIKEVFVKNSEVFCERPMAFKFLRKKSDNSKGFAWHEGPTWKGIKKIAQASLRNFGVGKKSMECRILEETAALTEVTAEHEGKPFDPSSLVTRAVSNIITSICLGSRFDYTDPVFIELVDNMVDNMAIGQPLEPLDHNPLLPWLPLPQRLKKQIANSRGVGGIIQSQIEKRRATFDENNLRDFIDLYLDNEGKDHTGDDIYSVMNIATVIQDLMFGGTDVTALATRWALLYMLHYPDIQTRLRKEIRQVVGSDRQPALDDKEHLPYLQAFMLETLRHASGIPMTLPHLCTADRQIGGYTIPKGVIVLANIYHVHMSERYWKNPTQFNPDRFLDTDGKLVNIKEGFLPFGAGPRNCIGETLARSHLFLTLACLIQKFTFKAGDENNLPPLQGQAGFSHAPYRYKIRAIPN